MSDRHINHRSDSLGGASPKESKSLRVRCVFVLADTQIGQAINRSESIQGVLNLPQLHSTSTFETHAKRRSCAGNMTRPLFSTIGFIVRLLWPLHRIPEQPRI